MNTSKPLVVVEWGDAHASTDFEDDETTVAEHGAKLVTSVGWVLKRDKKGISIVACVSEEDNDRRLFIPAGMIRRVRRLAYRVKLK